MATTVATIDVGGTGASDVATALSNLGAANVAAYAAANAAYAAANIAYAQANAAYSSANNALPAANIQTATSITAVKSTHYFLFSSGAATITLPASPSVGDPVWVTVCNGLANNIIARNGEKIMGVSEDMTIDVANSTVQLRYANTAAGWTL